MGRPKADDPANVQFHVRTTRAEADTIDLLVERWAEDMRAQGTTVPADRTNWFRNLVRREALARGIKVQGPPTPPK